MRCIRIGIVGLGKIALEEHVPALRANADFEIAACVSNCTHLEHLPCFSSVEEMLDGGLQLDAVAVCTPPQAHYEAAKCALERGLHVLLEKPPCPTIEQVDHLVNIARHNGCTLFQAWHARETPAVDAIARALAERRIRHGRVVWKEDVRQWHPRQTWIWRDGGFGVLDAGINAISILTKVVPDALSVVSAHLLIPSNCESPIAAKVVFRTSDGAIIKADFDFRYSGEQERSIYLETDSGTFSLVNNGGEFGIDGAAVYLAPKEREYSVLYHRFAQLIAHRQSDTDRRPLELVLDVLRQAERAPTVPFQE